MADPPLFAGVVKLTLVRVIAPTTGAPGIVYGMTATAVLRPPSALVLYAAT